MELTSSIVIQAPIEVVFDCWAALERSPEHQAPTISRMKLTEGPVGAGSRYSAVDQWPGRRMQFEMEITTFDRPARIGAEWERPMSGSWMTDFTAEAGQTRMDFVTVIEPTGVMGLLAPLMKPWAARQLDRGLQSFKDWVESGGC